MVLKNQTVSKKNPQFSMFLQGLEVSIFGRSFALFSHMKYLVSVLIVLFSAPSFAAPVSCSLEAFVKSPEGQEKLGALVDRSKGLILSKLEELGIEEDQAQIKAVYPKTADDLRSSLSVLIKAKNLTTEGSLFTMTKVLRDEDCGMEVSILGGHIINKQSGKDFGTLGRVKEFIRLN